ncbi:hypothetical protein OQA88_5162 [Cercophora sp. LCS_1]
MQLAKALVAALPFVGSVLAAPPFGVVNAVAKAGTTTNVPVVANIVNDDATCHVDSREYSSWVEDALTRWRTVFSSKGVDTASYCKYWTPDVCWYASNIQCYYERTIEGGTWVVDANFPRGPLGDQSYYDCLGTSRNSWINDYGCSTGSSSKRSLGPLAATANAADAADAVETTAIALTAPTVETTEIAETAQTCNVNSRMYTSWIENGLRRWRTVFSSSGIGPDTYCQYWPKCGFGSNFQCFFHTEVEGGTWAVDLSFPQGPAGDDSYGYCLGWTREQWAKDYKCTTG